MLPLDGFRFRALAAERQDANEQGEKKGLHCLFSFCFTIQYEDDESVCKGGVGAIGK
jgi:hypothetical protein